MISVFQHPARTLLIDQEDEARRLAVLIGAAGTADGDRDRAGKVYEGVQPLTAMDIADAILYAATRPPHVNVDEVLLMATAQASATRVHRGEWVG